MGDQNNHDRSNCEQCLKEDLEAANERIAELERELAAIKGQEPVARTVIDKYQWVSQGDGTWLGRIESHIPFDELTPLYALPVAPVADKDAEPIPHKWDRDGERCVVCGAKDWMGGSCDAAMAKGE